MYKPNLEKLIQEIAMFDMDAACKLHQRKDNEDYEDKDNLDTVMHWRKTKEGFDYWSDIREKLAARRKKPKVTKKVIECRIYLDTHGVINIVERDASLNISHFKQWLGDWQKVEIEVKEND